MPPMRDIAHPPAHRQSSSHGAPGSGHARGRSQHDHARARCPHGRGGGNRRRGGSVSRCEVLQLAGGAASLAAIPGAVAQAASPRTQEAAKMTRVQLTVNGRGLELEIDPRQSLLDVLRERLDLTGTKKGCNQGACGACTVLIGGKRVVSCLTLALMHDGVEVTTIEGLEQGGPSSIAGGLHRARRLPVRILHAWSDHVRARLYRRGPRQLAR